MPMTATDLENLETNVAERRKVAQSQFNRLWEALEEAATAPQALVSGRLEAVARAQEVLKDSLNAAQGKVAGVRLHGQPVLRRPQRVYDAERFA
jgi:hypothetical protein